jgi:hypothetical protein
VELTLGEFKEKTKHLPDNIIVAIQDSGYWGHKVYELSDVVYDDEHILFLSASPVKADGTHLWREGSDNETRRPS